MQIGLSRHRKCVPRQAHTTLSGCLQGRWVVGGRQVCNIHVVSQGLLFQSSAASDFYKAGEVRQCKSESFAWGTLADQSRKHRHHRQGKWVLWYQPGGQQSVSRSESGKSGVRVSRNLNRHVQMSVRSSQPKCPKKAFFSWLLI